MPAFNHGVYASQLPTSIIPPRRVDSAIPVVVGTAPVHLVKAGYTGPVNEPVLAQSYTEAVTSLGYSEDWASYTLCEFIYSQFVLFSIEPAVFINVFDPATHKTSVEAEAQSFDSDDQLTLDHPGLVADPTVQDSTDTTTYELDTDYEVDRISGVVTRLDGGSIEAEATVHVTYDYGDPSKVAASDIIGGIDAGTGARSGLELIDQVFPRYQLVPGLICAPGWSQAPSVAAVMGTKAVDINGLFKAMALVDLPTDGTGVTKYSDAPSWKSTNNYVDPNMIACWPKLKLDSQIFHMSTQLAGLIGRVDGTHESIPYESPSNKTLEMNGLCLADGTELVFGHTEANYLNGQGIVTALNMGGGWVAWGNRTAAYPSVTDVKDAMIPIQRMFCWKGNEFILTFWQKTDAPTNRRLVETIIDSENIRLNGLASIGAILGGRVVFLESDNPTTDLMDGKMKFHLYMTPPSPAEEIRALIEYDPDYLAVLFG